MDGKKSLCMGGKGDLGMDGEGGQAWALCHRDGTPVPRSSPPSPTSLSQERGVVDVLVTRRSRNASGHQYVQKIGF